MEWVAAPVPESAAGLERDGVAPWLAALLARRGVADSLGAERFLHPSLDQLHDPFLLAGMEEGVARLLAARDAKETVAIVGDYDVDGISSTALLLAVFAACKIAAKPILPNRLREGYGFQPVHVERAREMGCRLIVTADCGSSSVDAVEAALAAGIDVLVTDHHLPGCPLPAGALHINPRQEGCTYPFRDLAAVGLAFKLALALTRRCGKDVDPEPLLRIACLGTIADLVPLQGENRVIAALGLKALASARSQGLKALILQSGMKPPFTAADVGFRLGPRINAAGRLHEPERALELLMSRDEGRATALAAELDGWNRERQTAESRVVEEARRSFRANAPQLPPILVGWSAEWHKGVVGVAAGRLAKDFHRPVVLLAVEGELATGSGRSVPDLELHGFLAAWKERMERFGGHAQAIGLERGHRPAGGAAGRVGGGGGGVASRAAGAPGGVRAPPGAAGGLAPPAGATRGAGALRPGEPPAAPAHRSAADRRRAAQLRQGAPLGPRAGGGRQRRRAGGMALGGARGQPARQLRGSRVRRERYLSRGPGAAAGRQPAVLTDSPGSHTRIPP